MKFLGAALLYVVEEHFAFSYWANVTTCLWLFCYESISEDGRRACAPRLVAGVGTRAGSE